MRKETKVVELIDDLDGSSPAAQTITFGFEGNLYRIDLTTDHANDLRYSLDDFIGAATKVGKYPVKGGGRAVKNTPVKAVPAVAAVTATTAAEAVKKAAAANGAGEVSNDDIRAWALSQGLAVATRGRIGRAVKDAYAAAH